MFRKPITVRSSVQLKSSEKKKLRECLKSQFSATSEGIEQMEQYLTPKSDVTLVKVATQNEDSLKLVYCVDRLPIAFALDIDDFQVLYPTVYLAWRVPSLLPSLIVHESVIKVLKNGADLMAPGVEVSLSQLDAVESGGVCGVGSLSSEGLRGPLVIGTSLTTGAALLATGMRGKALRVLHCDGDQLCEMGPQNKPKVPVMALPTLQEEVVESEEEAKATEEEEGKEEAEEAPAEPEEQEEEEEDMESLLNRCFLLALKFRLKKSDLPILVSKFNADCLLPSFPEGRKLDIKQTRFKKLNPFLMEMDQRGLIQMGENEKKVTEILAVDWSHTDLQEIDLSDMTEALPAVDAAGGAKPYEVPLIDEGYTITAQVLPLILKVGFGAKKGEFITAPEMRKIVTEYVKKEELNSDGKTVLLDDFALEIVGGKERHLNWKKLFEKVFQRMTKCYVVTWNDGRSQIRKTRLPTVEVRVERRGGNKLVTLVDNLSVYGIRPRAVARRVQLGMACSAHLNSPTGKYEGDQVQTQGNQVAFLEKLLLKEFKLPRKYISGLEAVATKKKK